MSKSVLIENIRTLQDMVGDRVLAASTLARRSLDDLETLQVGLQRIHEAEARQIETAQAEFESSVQESLETDGIDAEDGVICVGDRVTDDHGLDLVVVATVDGLFQQGDTVVALSDGTLVVTEPSAKTGGRALHADDSVITVKVASNPKRDGSANHARFALLQSGQTVGQFVAAVEAATGSQAGARRTIRKAVRAGLIEVTPAAGSSVGGEG